MAEKIVSPGVFTRENDLSFVQTGVGAIGAAFIGPTVKGPAMVPTQVWSYSEYQALFGDSFKSGSDYYQYFTSHAAKDYLKHGGPLTVVRILAGQNYSYASGSAHMAVVSGGNSASTGIVNGLLAAQFNDGDFIYYTSSIGSTYTFQAHDTPVPANSLNPAIFYFESASGGTNPANLIATIGNFTASFALANTGDTMIFDGTADITITGSAATANAGVLNTGLDVSMSFDVGVGISGSGALATVGTLDTSNAGIPTSGSTVSSFTQSFQIHTIADGEIMNSRPLATGTNNILSSNNIVYGTKDNLRWEINTVNEAKGTFTLLIRRGDDTDKRKVILETHGNLSLDPQASNYIGKRVGTQYNKYDFTNNIIVNYGSYPQRSKYIYIDEASIQQTIDYLDDNGAITNTALTGSLPINGSQGTFAGGNDGTVQNPKNFYKDVTQTNFQGLNLGTTQLGETAYTNAINLLKNQDEYDVNLIVAPGVCADLHPATVTNLITACEERGDCMTIVDPVSHGSTLTNAVAEASSKDSSYAAMYWPWAQIADPMTGKYVWVPQSVVMPGIYAFNDKVSAEWFAPAGLNRGGQETVIQAEQKLTHANRDEMYEKNLNPVATFPGEGVVVWGQKTLQKKASALDRVNVRRLLINLKKFIASTAKYLVFENNTDTTRNRFLAQVNPYMESVQQRQGLYAFKVVMDASNNTPDIIDRNIMKGDIFIQPAKAAEFIVIDFNVMPTGATFND